MIAEWDVKDLRKDYNLLLHDFGLVEGPYKAEHYRY